jgi:transposase-like protein
VICYNRHIVLAQGDDRPAMNEQTVELIAERVIEALRDDLEAIAAELSALRTDGQLTVEQVARQLGVARSTVYAHWREWGGYKLGDGPKAPIRFDTTSLPIVKPDRAPQQTPQVDRTPARRPDRRRRRRDLLGDAPRLVRPLDGLA